MNSENSLSIHSSFTRQGINGVRKQPIKNNLSDIPDVLFDKITSFLSLDENVNLLNVSKYFEARTVTSFKKKNNLTRIENMAAVFSHRELKAELEGFYNRLEASKVNLVLLEIQQADKIELEQTFQLEKTFGSKKLTRQVSHLQQMERMERTFMDHFGELWALVRKHITVEQFKQQRDLFNIRAPSKINFGLVPAESASEFGLLEKQQTSFFAINEMLAKHGIGYFPLVEHFFYNMPSEQFRQISITEFSFCIECLLKKNQMARAVTFVNTLIKKHSTLDEIKVAEMQGLHSLIIDFYENRGDLSGAIEALKVISKKFKLASIYHLNKIITLAIKKYDKQAISDIFNFFQVAKLDLCSQEALRIKEELKIGVRKLPIDKMIHFLDVVPQKWMKAAILEKICQKLLKEKQVQEISDAIEKQREYITGEKGFDLIYAILMGETEHLSVSEQVIVNLKREIGKMSSITQNQYRTGIQARYLDRKATGNAYFTILSTLLMKLFFKNGDRDLAVELIKRMDGNERKRWAPALLRFPVKRNIIPSKL